MKSGRSFFMSVLILGWISLCAQIPVAFKVHILTNTSLGDSIFLVEKYVRIAPMVKDSPTDWHANPESILSSCFLMPVFR